MSGDRARVSVSVAIPPSRAFQVFTAEIDQWWRHGMKFRYSASRSSLLRIEPKVGGRLFESFEAEGTAHRRSRPCACVGTAPPTQLHVAQRQFRCARAKQMSSLRLICAAPSS
jgi:hypothetical protein